MQKGVVEGKEICHNLICQAEENINQLLYEPNEAKVLATMIGTDKGQSFSQQYNLRKGLKIFGEKGAEAAKEEMTQLHMRKGFKALFIEK